MDSGPVIRFCPDGTQADFPLYRRTQQPDGSWSGWQRLSDGGENCDQTQTPIILSAEDFQRLPLEPSPITVQPPHGWTLVNIETIVSTQPTPQTLTTTVLETPITVVATPTTYTWDFGDGTPPLVTTDPGLPWPHHTLAHTYPTTGQYPITLTTTWTGTYQTTPTGPWLTIDGHATTTATTEPLDVLEARTHLVDSY
ncbi:PKD domain-containing protein [Actinotalea sp. K2]|uniref:PKD domain-containing protein n=1 Tax=Actinotalea sp. K2 TaxID=2939438 RepID=UPI002017DE5D|nr:PKD domain-containing protein [Actinotalea sp. K2]MCL3859487.1 PKD domain-containing protein [Actinotalea sp. K2]